MRIADFGTDIIPHTSIAGNTATIQNLHITDAVFIRAGNYRAKWIKFVGCKFDIGISISSLNIGVGLWFEDCEFIHMVTFKNIEATGFDEKFGESISIKFLRCTFQSKLLLIAEGQDLERGVSITSCILNKGLVATGLTISPQSFTIQDDTVINEHFDISRCFVKQSFTIGSSKVNARLRIDNLVTGTLGIIKSDFSKDIYIWSGSYSQGIVFNYGKYNEEVKIKRIDTERSLTVIGGEFNDAFVIEYEDPITRLVHGFQEYYLSDVNFKNGFSVDGIKDIGSQIPTIQKVDIKSSALLQGDIHFSDLDIENVSLRGFCDKANISFHSVFINRCQLDDFYNRARLVFIGLRASLQSWEDEHPITKIKFVRESAFRITNSDLGTTQFFNCQLDSFKSYVIHNVLFSEITTLNVSWFGERVLGFHHEKMYLDNLKLKRKEKNVDAVQLTVYSLATHYKSCRETARQLKYAMERQSDKTQALVFQRWEMNNHRKLLRITSDKNIGDRFILFLGLTNDFGQNWLKAALLLIVCSFLIYIPIAILANDGLDHQSIASWDDIGANWETIKTGIGYWPQMLNPAHDLDKIVKPTHALPAGIYYIDFFSRIIVAFFIFQVIVAFRKYNR